MKEKDGIDGFTAANFAEKNHNVDVKLFNSFLELSKQVGDAPVATGPGGDYSLRRAFAERSRSTTDRSIRDVCTSATRLIRARRRLPVE